jgi:transcriptional regulator with XRE-family HTH domain
MKLPRQTLKRLEHQVIKRTVKLEQMLANLINAGGYSRNRGAILESVGVTAAALSQYTRGQTRPSFQKLLLLADFFGVSLDYLVYGEPTRPPVDHGSTLVQYVERTWEDLQARNSRHTDLLARISRVLADRVDQVASELAASPTAGREGLIEQDELVRIERYCRRADIVATDLSADIITTPDGEAATGEFFSAVAANLARGGRYRFLLVGDTREVETVRIFREFLAERVGGDRLNEHCSFRHATQPVVVGSGLYQLDIARLTGEEPALLTQFTRYLFDGEWLGYVNRPNDESHADMLMSPSFTERAQDTFEVLWNAAAYRV